MRKKLEKLKVYFCSCQPNVRYMLKAQEICPECGNSLNLYYSEKLAEFPELPDTNKELVPSVDDRIIALKYWIELLERNPRAIK